MKKKLQEITHKISNIHIAKYDALTKTYAKPIKIADKAKCAIEGSHWVQLTAVQSIVHNNDCRVTITFRKHENINLFDEKDIGSKNISEIPEIPEFALLFQVQTKYYYVTYRLKLISFFNNQMVCTMLPNDKGVLKSFCAIDSEAAKTWFDKVYVCKKG